MIKSHEFPGLESLFNAAKEGALAPESVWRELGFQAVAIVSELARAGRLTPELTKVIFDILLAQFGGEMVTYTPANPELPRIALGFRFSDMNSFNIMPFEFWFSFASELMALAGLSQLLMADWVLAGEKLYPEEYTQILPAIHKKTKTIQNWVSVAKQYPATLSSAEHYLKLDSLIDSEIYDIELPGEHAGAAGLIRRPELEYSFHERAASLRGPLLWLRAHLLRQAIKKDWTISDFLRFRTMALESIRAKNPDSPEGRAAAELLGPIEGFEIALVKGVKHMTRDEMLEAGFVDLDGYQELKPNRVYRFEYKVMGVHA